MNSEKVLIIDDDPQLVEIVSRQLEDLGYLFEHAADGQAGLALALAGDYALVVLDLGLPKLGGHEVCRRIRAERALLPILILTGESGETNTVLSLELGADEYITKPIKALEFKARVKALLRRSQASTSALSTQDAEVENEILTFKDLELNMNLRQVMIGQVVIEVTTTEFDLLLLFLRNDGRVLSRDEIVESLWGHSSYSYSQNLRTIMSRLRTKLESVGQKSPYIVTQRGFGYRLAKIDE